MSKMATPHDPAFPYVIGAEDYADGLSAREFFAAHALGGLLARPELYSTEEAARHARVAADELCCQLTRGKSIEEDATQHQADSQSTTEADWLE